MINETIDVNSFYFKGDNHLKSYPRQIRFGNRQYTFQDGLSKLVQRGQRMFELFSMTDGQTTFCLAQLNGEWRLIATKSAAQN
jgi:hypothetical protein